MATNWHPERSAFVDEPATMIRVRRSLVAEVEIDADRPKAVCVRGGQHDCPLALLAEAFGYARRIVAQRGVAT